MADNDFWSPGEKVLSGTELSDAKGQIPQGEISTWLCNISLKLQEKQKQFAQSKLNFYSEDFNCFFFTKWWVIYANWIIICLPNNMHLKTLQLQRGSTQIFTYEPQFTSHNIWLLLSSFVGRDSLVSRVVIGRSGV